MKSLKYHTYPAYVHYHQLVVEACVKLFGEYKRHFFDKDCTYTEEFEKCVPPEEVAEQQKESAQ